MREQYDFAAFSRYFGDGRGDALEPGGVCDAAFFHGHVKIDAQQDALALHVDVIEGTECLGHFSLASSSLETPQARLLRMRFFPLVVRSALFRAGLEPQGYTIRAISPSPPRCPP